jgi:hypothetical protein
MPKLPMNRLIRAQAEQAVPVAPVVPAKIPMIRTDNAFLGGLTGQAWGT